MRCCLTPGPFPEGKGGIHLRIASVDGSDVGLGRVRELIEGVPPVDDRFFSLDTLQAAAHGAGITRRATLAGQAMMTFFTFDPGSEVAVHTHAHDQLSVVVHGRAEFSVAGRTQVLGPGEGARLPGGVPHGVRVLAEETEIWDAWAPPRTEYL